MVAKPSVKRAKAKLGQNFLRDQAAIRKIVDALGDVGKTLVVEIGPGEGVITKPLSECAGRVVAIELDRILAAKLRLHFARVPNVEILEANVLNVDFNGVIQGHLRGVTDRNPGAEVRRAKLIGNLPYYITSDILLRLFDQHRHFSEFVIMVQKEVADRLAADPGSRDYGLLTATAQLYCDIHSLFTLPPEAFAPPPKVHSTVLRLSVNPKCEQLGLRGKESDFFAFLKLSFGQKRKTLANNLKPKYPRIIEEMKRLSLRPDARAEALSLQELAAVFTAVSGQ
jgi:16S rRNA (adenine1518-N6/adenine1519-N6)-dimethyltransferase